MARLDVMESVRSAINGWRAAMQACAGSLALFGLATAANEIASATNNSTGVAVTFVIVLVMGIMTSAALYRHALGPFHRSERSFALGPYGLQWAKPELRLMGALGLQAFIVLLGVLALIFVLMLISVGAVAAGMGVGDKASAEALLASPGGKVMIGVILAFCGLVVWASLRLGFSYAATIDRSKVQVFATWGMTDGIVLPLLGGLLLISLPTILLLGGTGVIMGSAQGTAEQGIDMPGAITVGLLSGIVAAVQAPLTTGFFAAAYRSVGATRAPAA